jgi:hypothetical protein
MTVRTIELAVPASSTRLPERSPMATSWSFATRNASRWSAPLKLPWPETETCSGMMKPAGSGLALWAAPAEGAAGEMKARLRAVGTAIHRRVMTHVSCTSFSE